MERFARIYHLHRLLQGSKLPVARKTIEARLDCSKATATRIIDELRNFTCDPIPYDRMRNGYHYQNPERHRQDLPFLWFSAPELNALLVIHHHLETLQNGFLGDSLAPLRERIQAMLELYGESAEEIGHRIKSLAAAKRGDSSLSFPRCAEAVLQRKKILLDYHARGADKQETREVSPQRLIHYRDNWYLDAWCHQRAALRIFAVERIKRTELLPQPAVDIGDTELDAHFAAGYGIFAGPAQAIAVLNFSAESARWVADAQWHPQQQGRYLTDGRYQLRIPYGNPTELIMDILKYGPDAEVLEPPELRAAVAERLAAALAVYREK